MTATAVPTPLDALEAVFAASGGRGVELAEAIDRLRAEAALPAFPETGTCVCGCEDWNDVENGYTRASLATFENGALYVNTDGWDDMSENGDGPRYAACYACGAKYDLPLDVRYS